MYLTEAQEQRVRELEDAIRLALKQKTAAACICSQPWEGSAACRECSWTRALEAILTDPDRDRDRGEIGGD